MLVPTFATPFIDNYPIPGYTATNERGIAMDICIAGRALNGRNGHEAGRALLAELYRQTADETLPPIAITERGKPYFPDSPWHFPFPIRKAMFSALLRNARWALMRKR